MRPLPGVQSTVLTRMHHGKPPHMSQAQPSPPVTLTSRTSSRLPLCLCRDRKNARNAGDAPDWCQEQVGPAERWSARGRPPVEVGLPSRASSLPRIVPTTPSSPRPASRSPHGWHRPHQGPGSVTRWSRVGDEMVVVLSELLANAFRASRDGHSAVVVRAWIDGDLALEVTNFGKRSVRPRRALELRRPPPARWTRTGHLESLVDDLAIAPPDDTGPLRVRCQRRL